MLVGKTPFESRGGEEKRSKTLDRRTQPLAPRRLRRMRLAWPRSLSSHMLRSPTHTHTRAARRCAQLPARARLTRGGRCLGSVPGCAGGFATYRKVMKAEFECPDTVSAGAQSLIRALLTKDVSKRCGCLAAGADDIRKHEWYTSVGFDWVKLATLGMAPPHIPKVSGQEDTSAFEQAPNSDESEEEDRADWETDNRPIDDEANEQFASFGQIV